MVLAPGHRVDPEQAVPVECVRLLLGARADTSRRSYGKVAAQVTSDAMVIQLLAEADKSLSSAADAAAGGGSVVIFKCPGGGFGAPFGSFGFPVDAFGTPLGAWTHRPRCLDIRPAVGRKLMFVCFRFH